MINEKEILEKLAARLSRKEYLHCVSTGTTASRLAERCGEDSKKALIAGYLHDCARNLSNAELLEAAYGYGIEVDGAGKDNPYLLHAALGVKLAELEFGITDETILLGISSHTTGRPGMSMFEKVIYLADIIEPGRNYPGVEELRKIAESNIAEAFAEAYRRTVDFVIKNGYKPHPVTSEVLKELRDEA